MIEKWEFAPGHGMILPNGRIKAVSTKKHQWDRQSYRFPTIEEGWKEGIVCMVNPFTSRNNVIKVYPDGVPSGVSVQHPGIKSYYVPWVSRAPINDPETVVFESLSEMDRWIQFHQIHLINNYDAYWKHNGIQKAQFQCA